MNRMYSWYDLREKHQVYELWCFTLHYMIWYEQERNMTSCDLLGKPHFCDLNGRRVWWSQWPAAVFARGPLGTTGPGKRAASYLASQSKVSWAPFSVRALITSKRCISFKVSLIRSNRNCLSPFHCHPGLHHDGDEDRPDEWHPR